MKKQFILIFIFTVTNSYCQSKKVQIELLSKKSDSLLLVNLRLYENLLTANNSLNLQNEKNSKLTQDFYSLEKQLEEKKKIEIVLRNKLQVLEDSLKSIKKDNFYSDWVKEYLKVNIPEQFFKTSKIISKENFLVSPSEDFLKEINKFSCIQSQKFEIASIENNQTYLKFDIYSTDEIYDAYSLRFIVTNNHIIITQSDFRGFYNSIVYDLKDRKTALENGISFESFDSMNNEWVVKKHYIILNDGHIWETGSYDMNTRKIKWLYKDRG